MREEKEIQERIQEDLQFIISAVTTELHDMAYLKYFNAWENNGGMGWFFQECVDITHEIMLSEGSQYLKWLEHWKTTEGNNWEAFSEFTSETCFDWYHMNEARKLFKSRYEKDECTKEQISESIAYLINEYKTDGERNEVMDRAIKFASKKREERRLAEIKAQANAVPYTPYCEADDLNPKDIVGVSPMEYVVDGDNFEDIEEAYEYWVKLMKRASPKMCKIDVFSRVWVSLSDEAIERQERPEGSVECNVTTLDFINNGRDNSSIGFELWEWVKETASPTVGKLPFQIIWEDVNNHKDLMMIEHPKYKTTFEEILIHIMLIDQMELGGRGFIEFDDNIAKQNVETILDLMERYRGATLV
jgi:hypothetical protein